MCSKHSAKFGVSSLKSEVTGYFLIMGKSLCRTLYILRELYCAGNRLTLSVGPIKMWSAGLRMVAAYVPVSKVRGSRRDGRPMFIEHPGGWLRLVAGRNQSKSAIGTGRARLCAYVKLSTLNSAIDPELHDRKVEDRANASSSA